MTASRSSPDSPAPTSSTAGQRQAVYAITLTLSPRFRQQLGLPGVLEAIASAAAHGRAPHLEDLVALGQDADFASLFVERLGYLVALKASGVLKAAGPFEDLGDGMYLVTVSDEPAARRVMEQDPLYRAGLILPEYSLRRWLVAI